ncbi:MAG: hypothetical protein DMG06_19450 [Acidobacteria bacterium]|nr:MAG: hypothetical protein DMG06_19450 [Acidobacteriota bacterium]
MVGSTLALLIDIQTLKYLEARCTPLSNPMLASTYLWKVEKTSCGNFQATLPEKTIDRSRKPEIRQSVRSLWKQRKLEGPHYGERQTICL